eukprot:scaffold2204_cov166-Amphora_coffeaeformis.AAC.3
MGQFAFDHGGALPKLLWATPSSYLAKKRLVQHDEGWSKLGVGEFLYWLTPTKSSSTSIDT